MTAKKPAPAKRGRKPKPAAEKLTQLTIRMRPDVLFGLDVVARHRRTSLSQAAEFLISQAIRTYEIDGRPSLSTLDALIDSFGVDAWTTPDQTKPMPENARKTMLRVLLCSSDAGRTLLMPKALLSTSEKYFVGAFHAMERTKAVVTAMGFALVRPDVLTALFDASKKWELSGLNIKEGAAQMSRMLLSNPTPDGLTVSVRADGTTMLATVSVED